VAVVLVLLAVAQQVVQVRLLVVTELLVNYY
jgi:hypothetical protein